MKKQNLFAFTVICAIIWVLISIYLSLYWLRALTNKINIFFAITIVSGIAYLPGFITVNLAISIALVKFKSYPEVKGIPVSILIPVFNEEEHIFDTLFSVKNQDYDGPITVIIIDNNSTDQTIQEINRARKLLKLNIILLTENKQGKYHALNKGLSLVETPYFITLDADTRLQTSAVKTILSALHGSDQDVVSVAGCLFVRNDRVNLLTKMQRFDFAYSITSIKHMQSLYEATLVAQGAFSIFRTEVIKREGGWGEYSGEDIILSWRLLKQNYKILFEPLAIGFTKVPEKIYSFIKQRARWARGMIEALRLIKPWQQGNIYSKYLTWIDLAIPFIDICYIGFFFPGILLSFAMDYVIVGPFSLSVLPILFVVFFLMNDFVKKIMKTYDLKFKFSILDLILFIFIYQFLLSLSAFIGYLQEWLRIKRDW